MNLLSSLKRRIAFAILLAVVPLLLVVVDGYRRERANAIAAIYRFLTKPWEDETLRATVREAFRVARAWHTRKIGQLIGGACHETFRPNYT